MTPFAAAALAEEHGAVLAGAGAAIVAEAAQSAPAIVHERSAPDIGSLLRLASAGAATSSPPRPLYVKPPDAKPSSAAVARR